MNLIARFKKQGVLQRELLKDDTVTYRRVNATVYQNGEIDKILDKPLWMEQIHTGDFHIIVDTNRTNDLETKYQLMTELK